MSFREPTLPLQDILDSIVLIEEFTSGMNFDGFRADTRTVAAVERKLQLISEAATRLGDMADVVCPGQPWRNIRGMGNWLRHQYDQLDMQTVWNTLQNDLPPLKAAVTQALNPLPPNSERKQ
ncbi:MAG: HepT-like ribonuclease domain-containing protein [Candidatus Korobacteraceae bacterium]